MVTVLTTHYHCQQFSHKEQLSFTQTVLQHNSDREAGELGVPPPGGGGNAPVYPWKSPFIMVQKQQTDFFSFKSTIFSYCLLFESSPPKGQ